MTDKQAKQLVETYIYGWRDHDMEKILDVLADDCVIVESHGPRYNGKEKVQMWIEDWIDEGSNVLKWEISKIYYAGDEAFCEWSFASETDEMIDEFEGITIFHFDSKGKIKKLREYRTTDPIYDVLYDPSQDV